MCLPLSALLALTCSSAPGPAQETATAPSAVEPVRALAAELGTNLGLFTGGYAFAGGRWEDAYLANTSSARYLLGGFTLDGGPMSLLPLERGGPGASTTVTARLGLTDAFFNESDPLALSIGREVAGLKGSSDYLGINQYVPDGRPVNDLGWDVYPEGLYLFLQRFRDLGMPLFVTENAMADAEGDRRSDYLRSHVYAVEQAVKEGVDVRGYFHWSLMDNFGLFRVDFTSPDKARAPTPAVEGFQDIARNLGLTPVP